MKGLSSYLLELLSDYRLPDRNGHEALQIPAANKSTFLWDFIFQLLRRKRTSTLCVRFTKLFRTIPGVRRTKQTTTLKPPCRIQASTIQNGSCSWIPEGNLSGWGVSEQSHVVPPLDSSSFVLCCTVHIIMTHITYHITTIISYIISYHL